MAPASVLTPPIQSNLEFYNTNVPHNHTDLSSDLTYQDIFLLIELVRADQLQCELDHTDIMSISHMFSSKCLEDIHNVNIDGKVIMFNTTDISYEVECDSLRVTIQLSEPLNSEELYDFTDEICYFIEKWDNFKTGSKEIMFDTSTVLIGH